MTHKLLKSPQFMSQAKSWILQKLFFFFSFKLTNCNINIFTLLLPKENNLKRLKKKKKTNFYMIPPNPQQVENVGIGLVVLESCS